MAILSAKIFVQLGQVEMSICHRRGNELAKNTTEFAVVRPLELLPGLFQGLDVALQSLPLQMTLDLSLDRSHPLN